MNVGETRRLDTAALADRLRDRAPLQVWNVLTEDSFDGRLIPGSRRVPLDRVVRTAREENLAAGAELVVYGSGPRCPQGSFAAQKLAGAGYRGVRLFDGGVEAWAEAGRGFERPIEVS